MPISVSTDTPIVAVNGNDANLCLLGASPDTGNLGVSALCFSAVCGVARRLPDASLVVFDEGWGKRDATLECDGRTFAYTRCGSRHSRRLYRPESMWNMRLSARLGGLTNPGAQAILNSVAVLDISGGDSFTDLYGTHRFRSVTLCKQIALERNVPLILLPQTYGPYRSIRHWRVAESITQRCAMAWCRDQHSFNVLRELLGSKFDPDRHLCGVDLAFGLESIEPVPSVKDRFQSFAADTSGELVGFNVSGLIFNQPEAAVKQYGLKADYRQVVLGFLRRLLSETDCRIVLIPHVVTPPGHHESDVNACMSVASMLGTPTRDRVMVLPALEDPRQVKWVIARLSWFCGTRMHATIAALSSGVPTAAIAYSDKTLGVFETCEQGGQVADPRKCETADMIDSLWRSWEQRSATKTLLAQAMPAVTARAEVQMNQIIKAVQRMGEARSHR